MTPQRGPTGTDCGPGPVGRTGRAGAACLLCLVAAALGLAGPAVAADTTPPSFGNATVLNGTAFEVVVEDEGGVDESSIVAGDFSVSVGRIDAVRADESGNDSVVTVRLDDRVRSDDLTFSLADGGDVADDAGNTLTDASVTVAGIDGFAPLLEEYEVTWIGDSSLEIAFSVDEPVDNVSVTVRGRESAVFDRRDFTERDTPAANDYRYVTNHTFEAEDEYRVTLERVSDEHGNVAMYFADRTVVHDLTDPVARVSGPTTATVGNAATFDGAGSSDEHGIETYEWAVDGNATRTNESITYTFERPGRHEVALTVTDVGNNSHTVRYPVEVLDATTTEAVRIAGTNGTGVDVVVGPDRAKRRVLVERAGGLAGNGTVVLDSLTLTVPVAATANLSTAARSGAPAAFDAPGHTPVETIEVSHEGAPVSDVTFRFSVRRTALAAANASVDGVSLFREQEGWTRLPTLRVDGNDTHVQYRATSPGLSRFVIAGADDPADTAIGDGATSNSNDGETAAAGDDGVVGDGPVPGGVPSFAVVDGRLLTGNVSAGEQVVVRATVANEGNATGTYVAGATVDGTVLGTAAVTVPAGERREVTFAAPALSGGVVAVNGTRLGALAVAGGPTAPAAGDAGGGLPVPVPNPLALWPGGLVGRVLGAVFWLVVIVYGILKGLAIYLGY